MNLIRTKSYFGQPFIFNDLSNFGGKSALFGHLDKVNKGFKIVIIFISVNNCDRILLKTSVEFEMLFLEDI